MNPAIQDGDEAFLKVDTRLPAHQLPAGTAAGAINKRFEEGEAWPRLNVECQSWGVTNALDEDTHVASVYTRKVVSGLVIGHVYRYEPGNSTLCTTDFHPSTEGAQPDGTPIAPGTFVATVDTVYLWVLVTTATSITGEIVAGTVPQAFARFDDPGGFDNLVLLTSDFRGTSGAEEDGGRGRAWRIRSGQLPQAIPLNGHDIWGTARLVPCHNGLVMLRHGNERHYFSSGAVDLVNSKIQLNTVPGWADGDEVLFSHATPNSYITGAAPPNDQTIYWVKTNASAKTVELYTDDDLTTKLDFTGGAALGKFFLERRATKPGLFGIAPPPLIMQGDEDGLTPFEVGFDAVPTRLLITAIDAVTVPAAADLFTVPNHRLLTGDAVTYDENAGSAPASVTRYVRVLNDHVLTLHTTLDNALAGASPDTGHTQHDGDFLLRTGASAMPMPGGREGIYLAHTRLGIINGKNNVPWSDALDPLHFSPLSRTLTANLGESDACTSLAELNKDVVIIGKENSILGLFNLTQAVANWRLEVITREYGFIAALATVAFGKDVWGFSRKGVVSVQQTAQGETQGVALPVSLEMKQYLERVDWQHAGQACAAVWNNRYFVAVPLKGQVPRTDADGNPYVVNNGVLVFNLRNAGWEGLWQGDELEVYCFARHKVFGEERLCFVNYEGGVCWLGEGTVDTGQVEIEDQLLTRAYTSQLPGMKLWLGGLVTADTQRPKLSVSAIAPGHNEQESLLQQKEYDRTKYLYYGQDDYVPDGTGDFDAPGREDYSATPEELLIADPDAHQEIDETVRMRVRDRAVQLLITNAQGSARIKATYVEGSKPAGKLQTASRQG